MNNLSLEMKQYNEELKQLCKSNPEQANLIVSQSLMQMGFIDQAGNILPPYNGEKINEEDFTMSPGEIQYIKRRNQNDRRK